VSVVETRVNTGGSRDFQRFFDGIFVVNLWWDDGENVVG
jgi:hypothetical protein